MARLIHPSAYSIPSDDSLDTSVYTSYYTSGFSFMEDSISSANSVHLSPCASPRAPNPPDPATNDHAANFPSPAPVTALPERLISCPLCDKSFKSNSNPSPSSLWQHINHGHISRSQFPHCNFCTQPSHLLCTELPLDIPPALRTLRLSEVIGHWPRQMRRDSSSP